MHPLISAGAQGRVSPMSLVVQTPSIKFPCQVAWRAADHAPQRGAWGLRRLVAAGERRGDQGSFSDIGHWLSAGSWAFLLAGLGLPGALRRLTWKTAALSRWSVSKRRRRGGKEGRRALPKTQRPGCKPPMTILVSWTPPWSNSNVRQKEVGGTRGSSGPRPRAGV